jgi:NAD+ kinase
MKKILFVANLKKDMNLSYSKEILNTLIQKGIKVFVDIEQLCIFDDIEMICVSALKEIDLMLVLGGDGTILANARKYKKYNLPIMGINLGRIGALAVSELSDYSEHIDRFLNNDYVTINHFALEGVISYPNNKIKKFVAFNDLVVHRGESSKILRVNIAINNTEFSEVYTDGLIVATPNGSSAYNLSAGGPLLSTSSGCYVITPICPQSKTFSSLVVSNDDVVHLTVGENNNVKKNKNVVIVDGDIKYPINPNDIVSIKKSSKILKLIQFSQQKSLYESVKKAVVSINKKGEK